MCFPEPIFRCSGAPILHARYSFASEKNISQVVAETGLRDTSTRVYERRSAIPAKYNTNARGVLESGRHEKAAVWGTVGDRHSLVIVRHESSSRIPQKRGEVEGRRDGFPPCEACTAHESTVLVKKVLHYIISDGMVRPYLSRGPIHTSTQGRSSIFWA